VLRARAGRNSKIKRCTAQKRLRPKTKKMKTSKSDKISETVGRTKNTGEAEKKASFDNLFETDWEVFVIKRDKTGKLVGKTACCALAPV
jgi:hypothetical protein